MQQYTETLTDSCKAFTDKKADKLMLTVVCKACIQAINMYKAIKNLRMMTTTVAWFMEDDVNIRPQEIVYVFRLGCYEKQKGITNKGYIMYKSY